MRSINEIIVHCSATREGQHIPVETIKKWHVEGRGWTDIGYHFYVELDGTIKKGRDIDRSGAHTKGHNRNSIGICYCGGVEADGKTPKDTRTPDRKSTRLNSSHGYISYAVFCLKKKIKRLQQKQHAQLYN